MNTPQNQILYYFGAGASFPTLPLIKDFTKSLSSFSSRLQKYVQERHEKKMGQSTSSDIDRAVEIIIDDINWLNELCLKHNSVDTAAKKFLTIGNLNSFIRLKTIICDYLSFIQFTSQVNIRYDAFIAGLYDNHTHTFPRGVKIVSWNYDIQFELAFKEYFSKSKYNDICDELNLFPTSNKFPDIDSFLLYKINGSSTYCMPHNLKEFAPLFPDLTYFDKDEVLSTIITNRINNFKPDIKFAFETKPVDHQQSTLVKEALRACTTLVVIGYSFPFFNRAYDLKLLANLPINNIYIQCPDDSYEAIKDALYGMLGEKKYKHIYADSRENSTTPFYIPNEFPI